MNNPDIPEPLSREELLKQGSCCGQGCRNCPYLGPNNQPHFKGSVRISPQNSQRLRK